MWLDEVAETSKYLEKESRRRTLVGPIITAVLALSLIGLESLDVAMPHAPALLLSAVVLTSFQGGLASALLSLGCTLLAFTLLFSDAHAAFVYSGENFELMLLWSLAATLTAFSIALLKDRSESFLRHELVSRKKLEGELRKSETRLRAVITYASEAFVAMDGSGKVLAWNREATRTFGWTTEEAVHKKLADLIIPLRYRKAHTDALARLRATGSEQNLKRRLEIVAQHKDGHELPVEMTIYAIQEGESYVFGSFLHDISEKKKAASLQSTQLAVTRVLVDAKSTNEALPRLLEAICRGTGWCAGDFWRVEKSRGILERAHVWYPHDPKYNQFYESSLNILQKGAGLPGQVWERQRPLWVRDIHDGENFPRAADARAAGIHTALGFPIEVGDDIVGVMVFYNERTLPKDASFLQMLSEIGQRIGIFIQRKETEDSLALLNRELEHRVEERTHQLEEANAQLQREIRERQRLYEQAETASRLKDEFLATVSHELRTPLNIIIGYADMLRQSRFPSRTSRDAVDTIRRNARAQGQIIDDLLDVSRIISGKLKLNVETVDLEQVLQSTIDSLRVAADAKKITVHTEIDASVGPVAGDTARIQQVAWNLLSNAIKFTDVGGEVRLILDRKDSNVRLIVEDTGKGIDRSFLPHVFDRFRQEDSSTTRTFGGLGLGLSIVRHIVEAHGGTVEAFSEGRGAGSRFVVTLPLQAVRLQPGAIRKGDKGALKPIRRKGELDGLTVLVVDDQEDARMLVEFVLAHAGAEVLAASSAQEAMQILKTTHPDVILSDIGMPDEDGYEFIRKVRKLDSEDGKIPAAALSAFAREEDRRLSKCAGFQLHVTKPVDAKDLVEAVSHLAQEVPCQLDKAQ